MTMPIEILCSSTLARVPSVYRSLASYHGRVQCMVFFSADFEQKYKNRSIPGDSVKIQVQGGRVFIHESAARLCTSFRPTTAWPHISHA